MTFLGEPISVWIAVAGAVIVKLVTSPFHSLSRAIVMVFVAVFSAYVFTEPTLDWLGLDPVTYAAPMAALIALTGEGIMRALMAVANDPMKAIEWIRAWRGH